MNTRIDLIELNDWKHFEKRGICQLPTIKVEVDMGTPVMTDSLEEETDAKPKSLVVAICVAARPEFSASERFARELRAGVLIAVPFKDLTLMELGLLAQNHQIQARLTRVFEKLVQKYGLDKLQETRRQVAEVKQAMHRNIEAALQRRS
uniref:Uncharacterized protein n=2 Tax=Lotharella globosa TaxID=91324 RepID=A0A7S3YU45_9EUKA